MEVSETVLPPRRIKRKRVYCDHCDNYLSKSTYYRHRSKYYNIATGKWIKVSDATNPSSSSSASDEDNNTSRDEDEETFDDNLFSSSEQYASNFPRVSSLPSSESSPSASAECRALPVEGKFIIK